jgi:HYR domain
LQQGGRTRTPKGTSIANQQHTIRLSSWARLVGLALLLGVGVLASLGLATRTAHAQPAATLTVTDCSGETGLGRIGTVISSASAGDTIMFSCGGTIPISSTLTISQNLTLDGSGQSVTLDGSNSAEVLSVNSGVSFTLNALTIAHGIGLIGGGLANQSGTVSISNSTFANNSASSAGGGLASGGGTVNIGGSIVANNSGGNCKGGVTDQGYNLESATDCGFTGTGSLQNTDPKLASALASNGGPTQTLALLSSSPAIDHIPAANCPATDQRGVSRLPGERCDIGAFEFPDTTPPTLNLPSPITVNATSPQGAPFAYTPPTAVDEDSPLPPVNCTPASGSTFAIGTTTVTCTVSDSGDTPSSVSQSFTVTVNGAATQVSDLISLVNSFGLPADIQAGFDTQLQAVQTDLTNNNPAQACSDLTAFINHVQAQSGKHLTVSQANQLLAAAK